MESIIYNVFRRTIYNSNFIGCFDKLHVAIETATKLIKDDPEIINAYLVQKCILNKEPETSFSNVNYKEQKGVQSNKTEATFLVISEPKTEVEITKTINSGLRYRFPDSPEKNYEVKFRT